MEPKPNRKEEVHKNASGCAVCGRAHLGDPGEHWRRLAVYVPEPGRREVMRRKLVELPVCPGCQPSIVIVWDGLEQPTTREAAPEAAVKSKPRSRRGTP